MRRPACRLAPILAGLTGKGKGRTLPFDAAFRVLAIVVDFINVRSQSSLSAQLWYR
jgi:hypothetical protein